MKSHHAPATSEGSRVAATAAAAAAAADADADAAADTFDAEEEGDKPADDTP
jgi:hypothetical protein